MQFGRTVLQLDKTVSADRDALRQTRGQLPGRRFAFMSPRLAKGCQRRERLHPTGFGQLPTILAILGFIV
jgi:hypothetical protein